MRAFANTYPQKEFVQEVLAQIPWYHNITLLDKVKDPVKREWYVRQTIEHGWSRNIGSFNAYRVMDSSDPSTDLMEKVLKHSVSAFVTFNISFDFD